MKKKIMSCLLAVTILSSGILIKAGVQPNVADAIATENYYYCDKDVDFENYNHKLNRYFADSESGEKTYGIEGCIFCCKNATINNLTGENEGLKSYIQHTAFVVKPYSDRSFDLEIVATEEFMGSCQIEKIRDTNKLVISENPVDTRLTEGIEKYQVTYPVDITFANIAVDNSKFNVYKTGGVGNLVSTSDADEKFASYSINTSVTAEGTVTLNEKAEYNDFNSSMLINIPKDTVLFKAHIEPKNDVLTENTKVFIDDFGIALEKSVNVMDFDVDNNGTVNILDEIFLKNYLLGKNDFQY